MKIALRADFDLPGFKETLELFPSMIDSPIALELRWRNITFSSVDEVMEFLKVEFAQEKAKATAKDTP